MINNLHQAKEIKGNPNLQLHCMHEAENHEREIWADLIYHYLDEKYYQTAFDCLKFKRNLTGKKHCARDM